MEDETIGSATDQRRVRQRDDEGGRISTERNDDPQPCRLQQDEKTERQPVDRGFGRDEGDNGNQPAGVQRDEERIVASAMFDGAALFQVSGIARRVDQLAKALQRDQRDDDEDGIHRSSRTRKPAVKPGPSALSSMRRLMR